MVISHHLAKAAAAVVGLVSLVVTYYYFWFRTSTLTLFNIMIIGSGKRQGIKSG